MADKSAAALQQIQDKLGEMEMRQADILVKLDRLVAQEGSTIRDVKKKPIESRLSFNPSPIG